MGREKPWFNGFCAVDGITPECSGKSMIALLQRVSRARVEIVVSR